MKRIVDRIAIGFTIVYGLAGALVSVHRHLQFETGYYDFGIFDQAIWRVSRFQAPIIDHLAVGGKVIFADHVSPIIFLLSPLYWITSRSEVILAVQAILIAASVLALYILGKRILMHPFAALAVAVAYALFIGIQNAVITDFHEITLLPLPLVLLFYAIEKEKKRWYFILLILCLMVKENVALLGVTIGLYLLLTKKTWRAVGWITILVSIFWYGITTQIVIPFFSQGMTQYAPTIPLNVKDFTMAFVDNPIKRQTLLTGFGSFLFFPLLYPPLYPALLQELASRFLLTQSTLRWSLSLHYGTELAILAAISTLYALRVVKKRFLWIMGILLILLSLYNHQIRLHGPLALAYNPDFYRHSNDFAFLQTLIDRVPPGASVMTQNNLASHFTHQKVWIFRRDYTPFMPDYVIFDLRDGQNPNNLFPQNREILIGLREKLSLDPLYTSIYTTKDQEIFQKIL